MSHTICVPLRLLVCGSHQPAQNNSGTEKTLLDFKPRDKCASKPHFDLTTLTAAVVVELGTGVSTVVVVVVVATAGVSVISTGAAAVVVGAAVVVFVVAV